ncbi:grpE family protein [Streptococcus pneumoniae GA06083]|jgi:grpE|uniref:Protein GrpE n=1 Tax=Streptococcus mitis (strain B6) TaxID=365659 RepID=D3HAR9_STRM6|nr:MULTISPECIES: nucleotide exchange factor GrpE [Streptococcus]EHD29608.1 grpE family protein [Streptococcus pneumoniae 4027-06]EHD35025.1 grpE family protein [Streptococcus pneumoniae 6735-05]EHD43882.1 grpE family protein [Streptococcus pneumoniae GA43265]EHD51791.1 grpE family protein [Streptococcus pneumoniae 6901-05]EHD59375.1 grpE family protein [Streptococcus pneumoniae GA44500]EHD69051.1 grpE family protein [Streptococcus pneumoniae 5787-06]EHE19568.1 grpE family protein [Streptococ
MSEEVLHEKVSYIVDKVEDIESLITRRLLEDKAKNSLIEELKQYLIYRQDLDKGEKFAPFMKQILQVIDRIESSEEKSDLLTSIAEELLQILSLNGLQVIDNSGMIDPSMHEVVNTVAVTDEQSENNIVEVLQKGYLLNNRVLRPSKVTIAK